MKRILSFLLLFCATTLAQAQTNATLLPQRHFAKTVPAGNYSGIAYLGDDRYAVVNDKSPTAGFYLMTIRTNSLTGDILEARCDTFLTSLQPNRDEEGICYVPHSSSVFVSGEADGQIIEYALDGQPTGRQLAIPEVFASARGNSGFEALTYHAASRRFWTTNEQTLRPDGLQPDINRKIPNRLRLQAFNDSLQPTEQYWYITDSTAVTGNEGSSTLGVSALAALDDGRLVVLEREIRRTPKNIGSFVHVKLYVTDPTRCQPGDTLQKQLLVEFRTRINLTARSFANYEGMCLGPRLADGRQLLMLCADSQNQYRGMLKDWFRTVVLKE